MASSFKVTRFGIEGNLTGSVQGTASYSISGLTASYAVTASYMYQPTLYFGEDVTADQKAENLRVLADLSTRGLGGMAQSSRVIAVIPYFGTPSTSEIQVTACISNSGTYTLHFILTSVLFSVTDGIYETTSAADGTLAMPSEAKAERIFYTNIDGTLDTGSVVDTWVTQSETRSYYGLPSPMEIVDMLPENSWFRYENRLSRGCHTGYEQGVSFYEFLLPGFDNSLTVRVTDSAVYVKWTAAGGVLDAQLNETSSNSIENHAVYDQYMTADDIKSTIVDLDPETFLKQCLTFEILTGGSITRNSSGRLGEVEYSLNGGNWEFLDSGDTLTVKAGDTVEFQGYLDRESTSSAAPVFSSVTCEYNVCGNILSILEGKNDAYYDILYDDILDDIGYSGDFVGMFAGTPVVSARYLALPGGILVDDCYSEMFKDCENLISAPELSSENLAPCCYAKMFAGCTSLTTAPELPATQLPSGCYFEMFSGSSVLNRVECMAIVEDTSSSEPVDRGIGLGGPTRNWLAGVAPTGTFVQNTLSTWETGSASGIPAGWTTVAVEVDSEYVPVPFRNIGPFSEVSFTGSYGISTWMVASASLPSSAKKFDRSVEDPYFVLNYNTSEGPEGLDFEMGMYWLDRDGGSLPSKDWRDDILSASAALGIDSRSIRSMGCFTANVGEGTAANVCIVADANGTKLYIMPNFVPYGTIPGSATGSIEPGPYMSPTESYG